jgi:uncharacterized integral membrane protein
VEAASVALPSAADPPHAKKEAPVNGQGDEAPTGSSGAPGSGSAFQRVVRFVRRHPTRIAQGVVLSLVAIVILQNLEPTSIDVLFWSFTGIPKLVLILLSMVVGAAVWELGVRWFRR